MLLTVATTGWILSCLSPNKNQISAITKQSRWFLVLSLCLRKEISLWLWLRDDLLNKLSYAKVCRQEVGFSKDTGRDGSCNRWWMWWHFVYYDGRLIFLCVYLNKTCQIYSPYCVLLGKRCLLFAVPPSPTKPVQELYLKHKKLQVRLRFLVLCFHFMIIIRFSLSKFIWFTLHTNNISSAFTVLYRW